MNKWMLLIIPLWLFTGCVVEESDERRDDNGTERVRVGDRLPVFSVDVVDGVARSVFSSGELTGATVIVFFNTSCKDCQRELPELNDYYLRHRSDPGFRMVAIAREEAEESIRDYWQSNGLSIPYSPQADRRVYNLFATLTIPRVYVCSPEGIVEWIGIEDFDIEG